MASRCAAIIGTGTMGPGMGAVLARAGLDTALYDVSAEQLEKARAGVQLAQGVLDRLEAPSADGGGIRFESDLATALDGAAFVIEAVPERLELKQELFPELERLVGPETVLASNTSGIPITKIASVCANPERIVGMHWSNPPHLIPMIEVIPGEQTSQSVVDATCALVRDVGYHPVVEREVPGFVENRILYAIMRECLDLVDRGIIDPEGLDLNVRWGIGYKLAVIGPMELLDMAGLDIYNAVGSYLNQDLSTSGEVSSTIKGLIDEGRLGMKTGGGIYDYTPEQIDELRAKRAGKLVAVRKALESSEALDEDLAPRQRLDRHRPRPADVEHRRRDTGADSLLRAPDRARRGPLPLRHGLRLRAHEPRPALRAARADGRADDPRAARALRALASGCDGARQLPPALRPRRRQQALRRHRRPPRDTRARDRPGPRPRAVRVLRVLGHVVGLRGRQPRTGERRRRAREGPALSSRLPATRSATTRCS